MHELLKGASQITISYDDWTDICMRTTNNPFAEADIPALLREAIVQGITVVVTLPAEARSMRLVLANNKFVLEPL